jgi:hypothetical protein
MVAEGFATESDVSRWEEAFARRDSEQQQPWLFPATFVAIGRHPLAPGPPQHRKVPISQADGGDGRESALAVPAGMPGGVLAGLEG